MLALPYVEPDHPWRLWPLEKAPLPEVVVLRDDREAMVARVAPDPGVRLPPGPQLGRECSPGYSSATAPASFRLRFSLKMSFLSVSDHRERLDRDREREDRPW